MEVPNVQLMEAYELGGSICDEEETVVGIFLEVQGDIDGSMMFLMNMESAHIIVNKLMMRDNDYREPFDEMDLSALKEIGNIIAASYLSALATLTNLRIAPSVPYISVDMAAAILSVPAIMFGQYGDNALFIETEFGDDKEMQGYFDCSKFTVNGQNLTSYKADVDTDANWTKDTEVIKTENGITYFAESFYRSAPYFDIIIDGITVVE